MKAGVKSTALLFGSYVKHILAVFGTIFVITLAYAGYAMHLGIEFFVISVGGCAVHLAWQLRTLDVEDPKDCGKKFLVSGEPIGLFSECLIIYLPIMTHFMLGKRRPRVHHHRRHVGGLVFALGVRTRALFR